MPSEVFAVDEEDVVVVERGEVAEDAARTLKSSPAGRVTFTSTSPPSSVAGSRSPREGPGQGGILAMKRRRSLRVMLFT